MAKLEKPSRNMAKPLGQRGHLRPVMGVNLLLSDPSASGTPTAFHGITHVFWLTK